MSWDVTQQNLNPQGGQHQSLQPAIDQSHQNIREPAAPDKFALSDWVRRHPIITTP